jgi:site-specific DNA-adenine methylase
MQQSPNSPITFPAHNPIATKSTPVRSSCLATGHKALPPQVCRRLYYLAWSKMRSRGWGQGPRGGWDQRTPIIGERWSQHYIARTIGTISDRLGGGAKTRITCCDFEPLIIDTSRRAVLFLDPPYFDKGSLYRYNMDGDDHYRLARLLKQTPHSWVLIDEDHTMVWELYGEWANVRPLYEGRRGYVNPKTTKRMTLAITKR